MQNCMDVCQSSNLSKHIFIVDFTKLFHFFPSLSLVEFSHFDSISPSDQTDSNM